MQTTTIEAGVGISGSISVGELLDPLNDLIERFSSIMTVVLASLAGQKVLLLISSHQAFLISIVLLGVFSITIIQLNKASRYMIVFRAFLVMVFIRFALGIAVALNSLVDTSFLMDQTEAHDNEINILRQNMSSFNSDAGVNAEQIQKYREEQKSLSLELNALKKHSIPNKNNINELEFEITNLKNKLEKIKSKRELVEKINVFSQSSEIKEYEKEIEEAEKKLSDLIEKEENRKKNSKITTDRIHQLEMNISGEPDGFFGNLKKKSAAIVNSIDIDKIEKTINHSIQSFMSLIAIYIIKTIIFPLLFFYLFLLAIKNIWVIEWSE